MKKLIPYHERAIQADIEHARAERKATSAKAATPTTISKADIEALVSTLRKS
jgi:hypothetical protein